MNTNAFTELEARLAGPEGPALREDLLQRLAALETRMRQSMAAGLARETFTACEAAAEAARAAGEVLSAFPAKAAGTTAI